MASGSDRARVDEPEVLVIGGGPAGSTAAHLLVAAGRRVVLLEKERFPRFHIGESLLPFNMTLLARLGIVEELERAGSVRKHGARFFTGDGRHNHTVYFRDGLEPGPHAAFHVLREQFDDILLRAAAARGVDVRQEEEVVSARRDAGHWEVAVRRAGAAEPYTVRARFLVDASGRDTFLAQRLGTKRMAQDHRRVAIYAHYRGVERDPGIDAGNIIVVAMSNGWFWLIPLPNGVDSVGLVVDGEAYRASKLGPEQALLQAIERSPEVRRRLVAAERIAPIRTTSDYSYRTTSASGEGYVTAGDAFGFIDPVFSSGVWLAMQSGEGAAEVVDRCLADPASAAKRLRRYDRGVRRSLGRYWRVVEYFYRPEFIDVFMQPTDRFQLRGAVNSVLAGTTSRRFGLELRLELVYLAVRLQRYMRMRDRLPRASAFAAHDAA